MALDIPAIYPITDTAISGLPIPEQVRRFIAGGATFIQIRDKQASSREFFEAAAAAMAIAREHNIRVVINDRVDIAMMVNADGVHLGQEDLSPPHARQLLGERAIIGYSTHTLQQAKEAAEMPVDYIAFGPVFPTSTKDRPDPVVGLEMLRQIKELIGDRPLVAIGGITAETVRSVIDAGADSAAIISDVLCDADKISERISRLISLAHTV